jgi:hypothetical protein
VLGGKTVKRTKMKVNVEIFDDRDTVKLPPLRRGNFVIGGKAEKGMKMHRWLLGFTTLIFLSSCIWIIIRQFHPNIIAFVGIVFQGLLGMVGIVLVVVQINKMTKSTDNLCEWNKKIESFKKIESYNKEFNDVMRDLQKIDEKRVSATEEQLEDLNNEYNNQSTNVLNYLETIASGIKHDIYDARIMYDDLRTSIIDLYQVQENFIKKTQDNENPRAWILFSILAKHWRQGNLVNSDDIWW